MYLLSTHIPNSFNSCPGGQTHSPLIGSKIRPRDLSQTHLPRLSMINPRSVRHGIQFPFSSNAYPGGHTQFSCSSRINPFPGGHVLTGVHSIDASPSYPSKQIQSIVRTGNVSRTTHSAFNPHGSASQGGIQFEFMHASLEAHSLSLVQPISTINIRISKISV